jgi:hypothetical protein
MKVTKAEMKMLENAFAAEVENRLPFQSRSELAHQLAKNGFLQPMEVSFKADRFGGISVKGWQLTHAGRITYCQSCEEPPPAAPDKSK